MQFEDALAKRSVRRPSQVENFAAPIGGWASDNTFQSTNGFTARILQNLIPKRNEVVARRGSATQDTLPGSVDALMSYQSGATKKLLAATSKSVYEVEFSAAGTEDPYSVELGDQFSNGKWESVHAANAADEVSLVMVNGEDGIWAYDGTTLEKVTSTPDVPELDNVILHKGRLWFSKVGSSVLYYGPPLSIAPTTLTEFPVGAFFSYGGSVMEIGTLSNDGGAGPDDYLVVISDRGEILIYAGIDPANDYVLVGNYKHAKPLGHRCLKKVGSDLIYYCFSGPVYLRALLSQVEGDIGKAVTAGAHKLTDVISTEFQNAIDSKFNSEGWDFVVYSRPGWIIFNVPVIAPYQYEQYAYAMSNDAWFKITGWNGRCWVQHDNALYFGDYDGNIKKADVGDTDDGEPIQVDFMQSWYEFQTPDSKKFNLAQLTIDSSVDPSVAVSISVDYNEEPAEDYPGFPKFSDQTPWDSPWFSPWSGSSRTYINWAGLNAVGFVGALRYRATLVNGYHSIRGYRIIFEPGAIL